MLLSERLSKTPVFGLKLDDVVKYHSSCFKITKISFDKNSLIFTGITANDKEGSFPIVSDNIVLKKRPGLDFESGQKVTIIKDFMDSKKGMDFFIIAINPNTEEFLIESCSNNNKLGDGNYGETYWRDSWYPADCNEKDRPRYLVPADLLLRSQDYQKLFKNGVKI